MRGTERRSNKSERDSTREGRREKGKHVRRLNVTEGLLFVVLWGGNELAKEGKGVGRGGGDQEEGGREAVQWEQLQWHNPERQADLLSQPEDRGLPTKQAPIESD